MLLRLFATFLLFTQVCLAQFPMPIQGTVQLEGIALAGVHISNLTSLAATTTTSDGTFIITVNKDDVLLITHISAKDQYQVVYSDLATNPFLHITLEVKENALDEVVIRSYDKITVQSVGIVQGEQRILTANERRLHTAGDFKPIHLLSLLGGSLQLDPIINAINGRTKRLKRYIEIDNEIAIYKSLYTYHADFMSQRFEIEDTEVVRFFDSLVDHPQVTSLLKQDNEDKINIWLCEEYLIFSAK